MLTVERRVHDHAIAAGILAAGEPMNNYVAEGAAWCADACASALLAGADLRDVSVDVCANMRRAGASGAEQAFAQMVIVEVEALIEHMVCDRAAALADAVRAQFRWTERVQGGGGIKQSLKLIHARDLPVSDRQQAKEIYVTAMLACFGSRAQAFRAWANWAADPASQEASPWRQHHARAQTLAFVGLDVDARAAVLVKFSLHG